MDDENLTMDKNLNNTITNRACHKQIHVYMYKHKAQCDLTRSGQLPYDFTSKLDDTHPISSSDSSEFVTP
ncbi:unnamed protein product [Phyllotreta striolata]|uniref:Uncharacterized protein n=1 Tax=Phyllotreta striolata TaxID=444603 RepID=A0A9N9XLV4_PHYSR|nr:unnamed protein product [Phyllotreta striolata]